mgnify:CR=1 FL=1
MTWEIALGLFALVAFVISIGAIVAKASHMFATLNATINMLTETLKEFKKDSKTDRKELHDRIDDHETRIGILEIKVDNRPNN